MGELRTDWSIFKGPRGIPVLRFTFEGVHDSSHGKTMLEFMNPVMEAQDPRLVVFDLQHYDYEFGNDVVGFFRVGLDKNKKPTRPICLLARGRTSSSLQSLFRSGRIDLAFDVTFVDTEEEVDAWVREKEQATDESAPTA